MLPSPEAHFVRADAGRIRPTKVAGADRWANSLAMICQSPAPVDAMVLVRLPNHSNLTR